REIYQLMQLAGKNRFRAIAFDRAAQSVEALNENITDYIENETLTDIKGIGQSIAEDIKQYAETGKIEVLEALRKEIPPGVIRWLDISGLGPKNIVKIHKELGISELAELKEACLDGRVASLEGLGKKSAEKICASIEWMEQFENRCRLDQAAAIAKPMFDFLKAQPGVEQIEIAGSLRRSMETVGDVDILIAAKKSFITPLFDAFVEHHLVTEVLGRGDTKSSIRTADGRQVDLRIVKPEQFAAALMYFTGSKEHNVLLRGRARKRGFGLNEYGLFKLDEGGNTNFEKPVDYESEQDIYQKLDLHFVPPELREGRGEIEYFEKHETINLVESDDIRGILHAHSTWSDGKFSIRQMAEACIERGYEYLGITDHSLTAAYAGGLKPDEVKKQWEEIDRLNDEFETNNISFHIFKGIESDILGDGSLDYNEKLLEGFDFVIASVHQNLTMPREKMMSRFRNAIKHPAARIVGHPTGRLLLKRDGSDLNMNELIELAAEHNTAIEINANPHRLDLDWRHGNKALEVGLMSSINPDAHSINGIDVMPFGIKIARKAKFNKERILNTKSADELRRWFVAQ
ncbi:MAG TPA: DNA polymerase/3'-5' exonuclease PolX, partial [Balneolaceae bacterium]|nr:DNA polymerase/3'-5' exonuclease PolX [Balneolaceae bacterium]